MIRRISRARQLASAAPGWKSFAESQEMTEQVFGYVSQPSHARLSSKIAAALIPEMFGQLPAEVLQAVEQHDTGWSMKDLAALESASTNEPASFVSVPAARATEAWRQSIRAAEQRSSLQTVLTSRHFCLLAPADGDSSHAAFVQEENRRRLAIEASSGVDETDLGRYTAALGFCDLVSLLMCSGMSGNFELPLAHPAHPEACNAAHVVCRLDSREISFDRPVLIPRSTFSLDIWTRRGPGSIANDRCEWREHAW